ncbi:MAG: ParB/RepB/Spo0J family partition protein [Bdellovibrionaceae bacterium]|nr:ParB/RepB/Spo0J family partition protein [Pseudobdellovibrionaceae bacterium]
MDTFKSLDKKNSDRLGRGLDFLLGSVDSKNQILLLDIEKVYPNKKQPRKDFNKESLKDLTQSIRENGLLQAILVEKQGENYQIIAGERRWRACCLAGLKKIPAVLKTNVEKIKSSLWALIENLQREDLNPIEQAEAFKLIMEESAWSQELLAQNLALSRSSVANSLRLLNLDPKVQNFVREGKLSFSQARELLKFKNFKQQREMAEKCLKKTLTVRALKTNQENKELPFWAKKAKDQLEKKFSQSLKLTFSKGKGSISFSFKNEKELKKILNQLLEK